MTDAASIAKAYIDTWNETNPAKLRAIVEKHWTNDVSYIDPMMQAEGQAEIASLVEGIHQKFPGFRFTLKGTPNGYRSFIRFSWTLGPEGVEPPVEGSDVVTTFNGKISKVIGFIDRAPVQT